MGGSRNWQFLITFISWIMLKNRVLGWFEGMWNQIFGVAVFHQKSKIYNVWSMWGLCLVSERSFLRDLRPFEKKRKKKSKNFKVAFLDFFWLQWLPGFQPLLVLIFQGIQAKKPQINIENGSLEGKSQLIWPPSIWVGQPCPIGPRGVPIKNLVQIMMFEAKNSTFLL